MRYAAALFLPIRKFLPEIREWQSRPLNPFYSFVFMDCIHYKVIEKDLFVAQRIDKVRPLSKFKVICVVKNIEK